MADSAQPQLLICHACGDNWVRDSNHYDSRLLCPGCGSDFVQIIEEDGGPPEREPEPERDSLPHPPLNPWADHNPWSRDIPSPFPHHHHHRQNNGSSAYDPMDFAFPVYSHHTYQSPDGRFSFSGTTMRGSFPPRQPHGYSNPMIPTLQALQTILDDFITEGDHAHQQRQHQHSSAENGNRNPRSDESPHRTSPSPDAAGIDEFAEFEGLFPRDTDRPPRMEQPVSGLSDLLDELRHRSGPRRRMATPRTPMGPDPALMISELLRSIGEGGPSRRFGDAVYSREALDEVIAQLGHEHAQNAGPPPASNTAIQSLPKKKINKQMLGSDGKAECAICKDTAELGTEVTTLPCEHWFHFDCIEAWLSRHNTCPNCRRSIDSPTSPAEGTSDNQPTAQDNPDQQQQQSSGRRRRRSSPFSRSSRSARSSFSRTSANSPTQETNESSRPRRSSRGEGNHRGGITGWVWSRFGGGSSS